MKPMQSEALPLSGAKRLTAADIIERRAESQQRAVSHAPAPTLVAPPSNPPLKQPRTYVRPARWRLVVDYGLDTRPSLRAYLPHYRAALRMLEEALYESMGYLQAKLDISPDLAADEDTNTLLMRYDEAATYIHKRITSKRKSAPWSIKLGENSFTLTSMESNK